MKKDQSVIQRLHEAYRIIYKITIVNFVIFVLIALILGGDAINGEVVNSVGAAKHYFVAMNGNSSEVSYPIYIYSKIHAISLFVSFSLAIIGGIIYSATGGKREDLWKLKSLD
jgi:hypothetical protein